jgi:hypothetical protein
MLLQPRDQNVAVGFVVVDHEDEGGIVHARLAIEDPMSGYGTGSPLLSGQEFPDLRQ